MSIFVAPEFLVTLLCKLFLKSLNNGTKWFDWKAINLQNEPNCSILEKNIRKHLSCVFWMCATVTWLNNCLYIKSSISGWKFIWLLRIDERPKRHLKIHHLLLIQFQIVLGLTTSLKALKPKSIGACLKLKWKNLFDRFFQIFLR